MLLFNDNKNHHNSSNGIISITRRIEIVSNPDSNDDVESRTRTNHSMADDISVTIDSDATNKLLVKYKKRAFLDYFKSKWRVLFTCILIVAVIAIWSPTITRSSEDLELTGSKLQKAMKNETLLRLTYAIVAIVIPNALDTIIDIVQFRTLGVSCDIHERLFFICLTMIPPWVLIFYHHHNSMGFYYMALNQSASVAIMCAINSMISKLERQSFCQMMYCTIPCCLIASGASCKIYGLWNETLQNTGITLSTLAYITQFVNFFYWTIEIVRNNIKTTNGKMSLKLDNIETTIILYFGVLICWMVGIFVSNYLTDSVTWRDSNVDNLISYAYLQLVLSLLIISLPMRWFRNEQIVVYETLAELNRNSFDDKPFILPNNAIQVTHGTGKSRLKSGLIHEQVTILYIDFKNITLTADDNRIMSGKIFHSLDIIYTLFDYCLSLFMHDGLEKIECVGFAYMVVCGSSKNEHHAAVVSTFASILRILINNLLHSIVSVPINIRMGIHTGPTVLGNVGFLHSRLSIFGETVNIAIETSQACEDEKVLFTQETVDAIALSKYESHMKLNEMYLEPREIKAGTTYCRQSYWFDGRNHTSTSFINELIDKCNLIIQSKSHSDGYEDKENDIDDDMFPVSFVKT